MLKNIIAPIQNWLLLQKRCVGCGMPLAQAQKKQGKQSEVRICKCKRIYMYSTDKKTYRRALLNEV